MCTGTGYVAKRSAIAGIGGWPLAFTGEDYMCSALLTGAGWEVIFVREPLQSGLAPESLTAAMKQRMRWVRQGRVIVMLHVPVLYSWKKTHCPLTYSHRLMLVLKSINDWDPTYAPRILLRG